jgi:hypothetical protein
MFPTLLALASLVTSLETALAAQATKPDPANKPFSYVKDPNANYVKDKLTEDRNENLVNCHIQRYLGDYSEAMIREVLPRITSELKTLLKPQTYANGDIFQVAESIDGGDLFHSHIRVPLIVPDDSKGLDSRLTASSVYHLQYHSFETADLFLQNWIDDLGKIQDKDLQDWLNLQKDLLAPQPSGGSGPGPGSELAPLPPKPAPLSDIQRDRFATLWLQSASKNQTLSAPQTAWFKARLVEKLKFIDQGDRSYPRVTTASRSVVSTDDAYTVIFPLALDGYIQPATVYFSKRSENPEIDRLVRDELSKSGLKYVVNVESEYYKQTNFRKLDYDLNKKLAERIYQVARGPSTRPRETFHNRLVDQFDFEHNVVFAWNDEYLFAFRYFIPCK